METPVSLWPNQVSRGREEFSWNFDFFEFLTSVVLAPPQNLLFDILTMVDHTFMIFYFFACMSAYIVNSVGLYTSHS